MKENMRLLSILWLIAFSVSCASSGQALRPVPFPRPESGPVSRAAEPFPAILSPTLIDTALELRGIPYRFGGSDPNGFDCSGFVQYVFAQHAIALPRLVPELYEAGTVVEREAVEPGDLLFFSTTAPGPSHVAIALGGGDFVHAPSANGEVRVERISNPYWHTRFVGARRVAAR